MFNNGLLINNWMIEMNALLERIKKEERAKEGKCGCTGCNNQATHTWSGHPICDGCGIPGRRNLPFPVILK